MKIDIIPLSKLEPFMQFKKYEGLLTEKLMSIKRISEMKLNMLKDLKILATQMNAIKQKHDFKCDKEMMKQIKKNML